ncbi:CehA/McbA family metallohydrolase [Geodermatophilus sp. DSM 44513]|uniref:CehA/McbA family metallohydrolase n=1 Tax=Geodermatophilus sp. DSM 44513 TaxID=1528104 RepID=UPI001412EE30|nr:CehA/McbA family metallohydrolase [Geodermatophilus sp. DSM 44513]WNV75146.1 CehA/McbA family metallohydrolase [Geodermatophilus sp. DSM 44513]
MDTGDHLVAKGRCSIPAAPWSGRGVKDREASSVSSPAGLAAPGLRWYRGDLHVHSVYSHAAELTPEQLASEARKARLDFLVTTEHNSAAAHDIWRSLSSDDLLVILGQEVTTQSGHWLALGIEPGQVVDWRYGVRDEVIEEHVDAVHRSGGVCVVAHPYASYRTGRFLYPFEDFDVLEVWNGSWKSDLPWQADNEAALRTWAQGLAAHLPLNRWRPSIGSSDTHLRGQIGSPQTVVLAEELSAAAILAGIRAGRCWIAGSAGVELAFTASATAGAAGPGERLRTDGRLVEVRAEVQGVPMGEVSLHTDRGTVHCESLDADGSGAVRWCTDANESAFVRVEVRHRDGAMAALANPVTLAGRRRT